MQDAAKAWWWALTILRDFPLQITKTRGDAVLPKFSPQKDLGIQTATVLECWDYKTGWSSQRFWSHCCLNRSGEPPPQRRPWCWPLGKHKDHWAGRLWTFDTCCKHQTEVTTDGILFRMPLRVLPVPGKGCKGELKWVCRFAEERTRMAKLARHTATALLAGMPDTSANKLRKAIPVLGFPVSHDPTGYFALRLLRSIDFPVLRLILVLNVQEQMEPPWVAEARLLFPHLEVIMPHTNLGCAGGWNTVVQAAPHARYWLICNNDVAFPPGTLRHIADVTATAIHARNSSSKEPIVLMRSFALIGGINNLPAFTLLRESVAWIGLFDENFWPVYGEDSDYLARLRILGKGVYYRDNSIRVVHGPEDWDEDATGHYSGSGEYVGKGGTDGYILSQHLYSADNGKLYCLKYGPVVRPDCDVLDYANASQYGLLDISGGWADWVLDPARRICILAMGSSCGYDRRVLYSKALTG